jgi:hypothetical protein
MARLAWLVMLFTEVLTLQSASVQTLSGEPLVKALRQGGYVLVIRHTSSPRDAPTKVSANPDNVKLERQLDETGRATATAMGKALRELKIPIGRVFTSPTTGRWKRYGSRGFPILEFKQNSVMVVRAWRGWARLNPRGDPSLPC